MNDARDLHEALQRAGLIVSDESYGCLDIDVQRKWMDALDVLNQRSRVGKLEDQLHKLARELLGGSYEVIIKGAGVDSWKVVYVGTTDWRFPANSSEDERIVFTEEFSTSECVDAATALQEAVKECEALLAPKRFEAACKAFRLKQRQWFQFSHLRVLSNHSKKFKQAPKSGPRVAPKPRKAKRVT